MNVDVVPDGKALGQAFIKGRVRVLDAAQRLVREDDPETESVVRSVALPDFDLVIGVEQRDQRRQVKACRSTSDDCDVEGRLRGPQPPSRSL